MEYRNIAIVAHVDHGKTTLVDGLLHQSKTFRANQAVAERVMDSNDIERERGITILAKNTAIMWNGVKLNLVDTPGHADFGGEVERALSMVDGVLVLVDAAEGPMPQTRFVLSKAIKHGLKPIVVINKIDRRDARPDEVVNLTFDLMAELGATEEQLDFPIIYAIGKDGKAWTELDEPKDDFSDLFEVMLEHIPAPKVERDAPFQFQIANLDYSDYLGRLAIGLVSRGTLKKNQTVLHLGRDGEQKRGRVTKTYTHMGLERQEVEEVEAGDIVLLSGLDEVQIGDTFTDPEHPDALPVTAIDEPTMSVNLSPNTSPFAGKDGRFLTSRHIKDRLERELLTNVALKLEDLGNEQYRVSGRGELHLSVLMEEMRREGYEFSVSRPEVILKEIDGKTHEPYEHVSADVPEGAMGVVMESLASRKGELINMVQENGRAKLEFIIPSRALFGYRNQFLSMTQGEGLLNSIFDSYRPFSGDLKTRQNGSLVVMEAGKAFAYSIFKLQDRGTFFIEPNTEVYVGMIVGANARQGDLNINVNKNKKLTNVRAAGSDDNLVLVPPRKMGLEEALEYIEDDELVEVTPTAVRLRKRILDPNKRKR